MAAPFGAPERFDPIAQFQNSLRSGPPWESIVDFATHRSFCGYRLYPRQATLLKLIYLETEMMTDYDIEVINGWAEGFKDTAKPWGVQPDIWERVQYLQTHGYDHFMNCLAVMGRRASKGIMGAIVGAERMAWLYSQDSWQTQFGWNPSTIAEIIVVATSLSQAARRQFRDIRSMVRQCEYLKRHMTSVKYTEFSIQTPGDLRYIDMLKSQNVPIDPEFSSIYACASSSVSTSQRGGNSIMNAFDEMAHMLMGSGSTKSGEEIYEAYDPSLDSFGTAAITWIPSSPFTMVGKFYELYQEGIVLMDDYSKRHQTPSALANSLPDVVDDELDIKMADPTKLVIQLPSWELYTDWDVSTTIPLRKGRKPPRKPWGRPVQFPLEGDAPENVMQRRRKQRNPSKFRVEREAQFAAVEDAYLDENKVIAMFAKPWFRERVTEQERGTFSIAYRAHGDPSRSNANFGFAIGHVEWAPCDKCHTKPVWSGGPQIGSAVANLGAPQPHVCDEGGHMLPHVMIDKLHVWKPENFPEHTLDYVTVGDEIEDFLTRFPSIKKLTYDQHQSQGFISAQKRKFPNIRVFEKTFTAKENQDRFEKFKAALYLGLVHSYIDDFGDNGACLLDGELRFLQEKNGKVDKQEFGPVTTKDLADAVMVVTVDLLHDHLDRWYKGHNRAVFGSTQVAPLRSGREFERMAVAGITEPSSGRISERGLQRGAANRQALEDRRLDRIRGTRRTPASPIRSRGRFS